MKNEIKVYRLTKKINDYDDDKDGCEWSHILEYIEKAYLLGRESFQVIYDKSENGVTP